MTYHSTIRHDVVSIVPRGRSLLDVGGGTGATARYLKEIGRVHRISVMDAVIGEHLDGLESWSTADLNDHASVAAYLEQSGPFDIVLMLDVLEHLEDPWSAVALFATALSQGGSIIASIPNVRHYSASIPLLFANKWEYSDAGLLDRTHLRFFVRDTAIKLMDQPGLEIVSVQPSPINRQRDRLLNFATLGRLRSFFTLQYFVVARKTG